MNTFIPSKELKRGDLVIVNNPQLKTHAKTGRVVGKNSKKVFVVFSDIGVNVYGKSYPVSYDRFNIDTFHTLLLKKSSSTKYQTPDPHSTCQIRPKLTTDVWPVKDVYQFKKDLKRFFKLYKMFYGKCDHEVGLFVDGFRMLCSDLAEDNHLFNKFSSNLSVGDLFQFMNLTRTHSCIVTYQYSNVSSIADHILKMQTGTVFLIKDSVFEIERTDNTLQIIDITA